MIVQPKALNRDECIVVELPASKSISNRLLMINALSQQPANLINVSKSDDSKVFHALLNSNSYELDAGMAGTAYRFMLAYLCLDAKERVLTGHQRMLQRPIGPLVEALTFLGASITYLKEEGFPPLRIRGGNMNGELVEVDGSISSQFISALMMIGPLLNGGLCIGLKGKIVSWPYIKMTAELMKEANIDVKLENDNIIVKEGGYSLPHNKQIEKDWSSASFFYALFALSDLKQLKLNALYLDSVQGDKQCAHLFEHLGVVTTEIEDGLLLSKKEFSISCIELNMIDAPDLILPFVTASSILLETVKIEGITTLFDKESNRVEALQNELGKFGIKLDYNDHQLWCSKQKELPKFVEIEHYNDHRMAMCLSILAVKGVKIELFKGEVVNKSFPNFWNELGKFLSVNHSLF